MVRENASAVSPDTGDSESISGFSRGVVHSTAECNSSTSNCPYLAAMRAIVEALQPAILATLAIGTAASSMRKIWVKSWHLYRVLLIAKLVDIGR
jgi:hypothetical protein